MASSSRTPCQLALFASLMHPGNRTNDGGKSHHKHGPPLQMGLPEYERRKFPTADFLEQGLSQPEDLVTKGPGGYYHVRCPDLKHECPSCKRIYCHIDTLVVAVDGACPGNGTGDASLSACGVYLRCGRLASDYSDTDGGLAWRIPNEVGQPHTNQRAEIYAAIMGVLSALKYIKHGGQWNCDTLEHPPGRCCVKHLVIKSDSAYLVNSITVDIWKWQKNAWQTSKKAAVKNQDLWKQLLIAISIAERAGAGVQFWFVSREQNKEADTLANMGLSINPGSWTPLSDSSI